MDTKDDLDTLITDIRKSEFLQHIIRQLHKFQDEAVRKAEAEVSHLRAENASLRAQFALSAMELPGQSVKEAKRSEAPLEPETLVSKDSKHNHPVTFRFSAEPKKLTMQSPNDQQDEDWNSSGRKLTLSASKHKLALNRKTFRKTTAFVANIEKIVPKVNGRNGHVFVDKEAMKDAVRKAIHRPHTNVQSYYYQTGWAQYIARQTWFEYLTLAVICINAIWISVDADLNNATVLSEAGVGFQVVENLFCVFFFSEWLVRLCALEHKAMGLKHDGWFVFDGLLLLPMVTETWLAPIIVEITNAEIESMSNTSVLKLLRMSKIVRMGRMVRLLRSCPELLVLIKGIWIAAKSVFFTLFLLMIVVYVFAVTFRQMTDGSPIGEKYFRSVPFSMKTLLLDGIIPDLADFMNDVGHQHFAYAIIMVIFILLASLTVMNMLIGVLVQVVSVVSAVESEQMKVNFVKQRLMKLLHLKEEDLKEADMYISRKEFEMLLLEPEATKAMQDIGVDPVGLVDFGDYIFAEATKHKEATAHNKGSDCLSFGNFIDIMLQFRGTNTCTVKDVVDMRKVMNAEIQRVVQALNVLSEQLRTVTGVSGLTGMLVQPLDQHLVSCRKASTLIGASGSRGDTASSNLGAFQTFHVSESSTGATRPSSGNAWAVQNVRPPSVKTKVETSSGTSGIDNADVLETAITRIDPNEVVEYGLASDECALIDVTETERRACAVVPSYDSSNDRIETIDLGLLNHR